MKLEMKCPVCGEKIIKELPEIEYEYCDESNELIGIATVKFNCPECEKNYYVGG